jgi:hypothetical protein
VRIEHIDDLGEIGERTGQPVDLVDDNDLHLAGLDIGKQPLQSRPLHRPARQASVVVRFGERNPSGMTLARDIGLTSLPLSVERVELLLEPIVGRFPGVDRATGNCTGFWAIKLPHVRPPCFRRSSLCTFSTRKNADPTKWAPVILWAMTVRDR